MESNRKKILLLAPPNSIHTIKWANELYSKGFNITVYGINSNQNSKYLPGIEIFNYTISDKLAEGKYGTITKILYVLCLPNLIQVVKKIKPDIIHAHYASSYGLLGTFLRFKPFIVSVWGADVFSFPDQSFLHRSLLRFVFSRADRILSTSEFMKERCKLFTSKEINVTPFGVDLKRFDKINDLQKTDETIIGTIKALEPQYGVEFLIKAFKIIVDKYPLEPFKLLIVGKGYLENDLKNLTIELGIANKTVFTGFIAYEEIPIYHNLIDIFVAVSVLDDESFGVAVVEAQACYTPVIVSDAGGLSEVVERGKSGFVVPKKNAEATAEAIEKLLFNKELRNEFGNNGRLKAEKFYELHYTIECMINIYKEILN